MPQQPIFSADTVWDRELLSRPALLPWLSVLALGAGLRFALVEDLVDLVDQD